MKKKLFVGAIIMMIAIVCSINLYISNKSDKSDFSIYLKNIEMLASAECNCSCCRWKILEGSGYCVRTGDGNSCECGGTTH
jgi:hypothetical protein